MSKEVTLAKVDAEIAEGKLGIARDRMAGLINSYPEDLTLRSKLGDIYWALGYPKDAGRWWFLDKDLSPEKKEAVRLFLDSCLHDPQEVLRKLKLPGANLEEIENVTVHTCVEIAREHLLSQSRNGKSSFAPRSQDWGWLLGCSVLLCLALAGIVRIIGDIIAWLR